jgi:hypothetical protein
VEYRISWLEDKVNITQKLDTYMENNDYIKMEFAKLCDSIKRPNL